MLRLLLAVLLLHFSSSALAQRDAAPSGADLSGQWLVNTTQSDDAQALLERHRDKDRKRLEKLEEQRRRRMQDDPFAWEPEWVPPQRTPQHLAAMRERERKVHQMLGMTHRLEISQSAGGAQLTIGSDFETRRFQAGTRSQVSLPQGQLADSQSGWDGQWFVIDRNARNGPRIIERYRYLKKTDQLEMQVAIKGRSELSGMKLRRVFDRVSPAAQAASPDPMMGPTR